MKDNLTKEQEEKVKQIMKKFGYSRALAIDRMYHWE